MQRPDPLEIPDFLRRPTPQEETMPRSAETELLQKALDTEPKQRSNAQLWSRLEKIDEKMAALQAERNDIVATLQSELSNK